MDAVEDSKTNETSKEGTFNEELKRAVRYLYSIGKVSEDQDIAHAVDLDKSTISPYLRGKVQASKNFKKRFEAAYNISLDEFQTEQENRIELLPGKRRLTVDDYINKLEEHNQFLQRILESNLDKTRKAALTSVIYHKAWVERAARIESAGDSEKKKVILEEMDTIINDLQENYENRDNEI